MTITYPAAPGAEVAPVRVFRTEQHLFTRWLIKSVPAVPAVRSSVQC